VNEPSHGGMRQSAGRPKAFNDVLCGLMIECALGGPPVPSGGRRMALRGSEPVPSGGRLGVGAASSLTAVREEARRFENSVAELCECLRGKRSFGAALCQSPLGGGLGARAASECAQPIASTLGESFGLASSVPPHVLVRGRRSELVPSWGRHGVLGGVAAHR